MCKTIQDSVESGTLSYLTGAILISTGKPKYIWLGAFVLIIGTMQFVDATIWYMKQNSIPTLEFSKWAVMSVLVLEPLAAYLGYVYYSGTRMILYEVAYLIVAAHMFYRWFLDCKETTVTDDGYLVWCGTPFKSIFYKTIFIVMLFFPFLFFPDVLLRNVIMLGAVILWLYNFNHEAFGSRWCHSFNVLDTIILGNLLVRG